MPSISRLVPLLAAALLVACGSGGGTTDPLSAVACAGVAATVLSPGGHLVVDPATTGGCLRLPAAGGAGAEYLVVALSGNGQESPNGVHGSFRLFAVTDTFQPLEVPLRAPPAPPASRPAAFDAMLRAREREIATRPGLAQSRLRQARLRVPPTVGSTRTFQVCKTASCSAFVGVQTTARYVGTRSAIFVDDTVPANGFSDADIQRLGALFDQHLYPIDTTAFGRESDLDGNGVVAIVLTDQLNALSPNCQQTGQVILGYFFGLDLDVTDPHSNQGEVFYGVVPDPGKPACFGKTFITSRIASTAIHEFQHMISFNRHVLLGRGPSEETWLNEGLSHLAEELGGRLVPDSFCVNANCLNQFAAGNLTNGFDYLTQPVTSYLVEPGTSSGTLRERGANWLFVRWLLDRSTTDSVLGTDLSRRLDGADQAGGLAVTGAANVTLAAQAFDPAATFPTLAGEWHLANYLASQPAFVDPANRLTYRSWALKQAFATLLPGPYPLHPDSTAGIAYGVSGTLLGGSGTYLRVVQPAGAAGVAVGLRTSSTALLAPRFAVARIR